MSCTSLRTDILSALRTSAEGNIQKARINIEVYLHNPVGIGEHPQQLEEMDKLVDKMAAAEDKLKTLNKHFNNTQI